MKLRERGIYCLPNGRQLIVHGDRLVAQNHQSESNSTFYELSEEGRLLLDGRLTAWDISDLRETDVTFHTE